MTYRFKADRAPRSAAALRVCTHKAAVALALAGIVLAVALAAVPAQQASAAQVPASSSTVAPHTVAKWLRASGSVRASCSLGRVCVYADAGLLGHTVAFYRCGLYDLAANGFPPNTLGGVTSWWNNQTGGAPATFAGSKFIDKSAPGSYSMPAQYNDKATTLTLC